MLLGLRVFPLVAEGLIEDEIGAYAYFGKTTQHGVPQEVPRYVNVTSSEFEELALSGRPFVLEDGGRGQPFVGWTCERFRQQYPEGVVKVEYVRAAKTTWSMQDDWEAQRHWISGADPQGPQYAPWYWGVKGADEPEEASSIFSGPHSPLPHVQSTMRLPPFLRKSAANEREVFGSPEFWFSAPKAGAALHMDAHCESTLAIQLSGTRKWRLGWVPPVPNGTLFKEGTYGDGAVYGKGYTPPLEAVVSEGEALFMPAAFLHETTNVGSSCAVSLTFQFRDPSPTGYFQQSLRHLRRTADFQECWPLLARLVGGEAWAAADAEARAPGLRRLRPQSFGYLAGERAEL